MESESKHRRFFNKAKELSFLSKYHHKIGAVVVKKGKDVGRGVNNPFKTHPQSTNPFKTVHAELDAILSVVDKNDLIGATIYVYRQHKNGQPACSKPCPHCEELIRRSGIRRVCYTANGHYEDFVV